MKKTLILKTDALGRVRMPADRREAILDAFEGSGLSGQAFAKHIGVKYSTFAGWMQKRRRERGDYSSQQGPDFSQEITFVEAQIEESVESNNKCALEVCTKEGVSFLVSSQEEVNLAASLIHALNKVQ